VEAVFFGTVLVTIQYAIAAPEQTSAEDQRWAHVANSVDFDAWATPPTARLLAERGAT
jgi:hypothetical protein